MILNLAYYGDPSLREKAKPVEKITDEVVEIVDNMIETMLSFNGVGLAATQVRIPLRIFIIRPYNVSEDGKVIMQDVLAFINPKLSSSHKKTETFDEGCLSIPGIYGSVTRPKSIFVTALDRSGNTIEEEFGGIEGRIIMHEYDHLNGILYIDHLRGKQKRDIQPLLTIIEQEYHEKGL